MRKPIYIIGAGAIGKALAVFLQLQGKEPILIRGSVDDGSDYHQHINVELADHTILSGRIETATASNYTSFNNLVVFTNKAFANARLAGQLKKKIGDTPAVIMQNGLTVEQPFISHDYPNIYRCVLFTSCQFTETGSIKFKPAKSSRIGIIKGTPGELDSIVSTLQNDHLRFEAEADIQSVIWTKTIANCIFNSVCPLLETDNGIFQRNQQALGIARRVIDECIAVAGSVNVHLRSEDVLDILLHISKTSDGQRISTYEDILHHRQTEIDTLNLAVVEIARKHSIVKAVSETRLLGELIAIKAQAIGDGGGRNR